MLLLLLLLVLMFFHYSFFRMDQQINDPTDRQLAQCKIIKISQAGVEVKTFQRQHVKSVCVCQKIYCALCHARTCVPHSSSLAPHDSSAISSITPKNGAIFHVVIILGTVIHWRAPRPSWRAPRASRRGTDKRTDGRTVNLPILKDFVPYRGRYPKSNGGGEEEDKPDNTIRGTVKSVQISLPH